VKSKIRTKAPGEIEIAFMRERRPRRRRNRFRRLGHNASRGENRVVRNNREPGCSFALRFAGSRSIRQKLFHLIDFVSRLDQQARCYFMLFVLLSLNRPNHNLSHAIE
jgi:hypothetical protein